ncbi:hypothetical protein [Shewanella fodinae]|uniref:hypothetical protein n=1 Tax=Shewanella fodinae TaxID=552357 RepID=UPI00167B6008|nr:hypothetical protein [Shewanella fodinae]MCL2905918.1 hypothetical protein [Shewanella fodinae]GGY95120.1 hypothetical protein GCM10007169_10170 [Shewanella fodinae]
MKTKIHGTQTPVGNGSVLSQLDLNNKNIQFELLSYDKHQTLEGLQIEPIAMTYIKHLEHLGLEVPNVTTVIAKQKGAGNARCFFVWDRNNNWASQEYIRTLQRLAPYTTFSVGFDEESCDFYCHKPGREEKVISLQTYLQGKRSFATIPFPSIKQNVRDIERQMAVFWGRLHGAFETIDNFRNEVLLNRVMKNFVIQPFFSWLWDLDRIVLYRNQYWEIELKHKYPFRRGTKAPLKFGINIGQAKLVRDLGTAGVRTLHLILVKPDWKKDSDPGYIFNRRDIYHKVLLIGTELTLAKAEALLNQKAHESDETTSFTGATKNHFLEISATDFHVLGSYQTPPEEVARNIKCLLDGVSLEKVTDRLLESCRINK